MTCNRLKLLQNTLDTFIGFNSCDSFDFLVYDNGSHDGTLSWLKKKNYEYISNDQNIGIFLATRELWLLALKRGYEFVLNLQNDFPSIRKVPVNDCVSFLAQNSDVGFIRLNDKSKMIKISSNGQKTVKRQRIIINKLTMKRLKIKRWQKCGDTWFSKFNFHFNFNPNLFKSSIIEPVVGNIIKTRERQIMEKYHKLGLWAARIKRPCFETILRARQQNWKH